MIDHSNAGDTILSSDKRKHSENLVPSQELNSVRIASSMKVLLNDLQSIAITSEARQVFSFSTPLEICDRQGNSTNGSIAIAVEIRELQGYVNAHLTVTIYDQAKDKVAYRHYHIQGNQFSDTLEVGSGLYIENREYKGVRIGSVLIHQGEAMKLLLSQKIGEKFSFSGVHSVLVDISSPRAWTTNSARALGYTRVKGKKGVFERTDEFVTDMLTTLPPSLTETWKNQNDRFLRFRLLFHRLMRW